MALTSTLYNFDIDLADSDRGVYETLALRVARHPSESEDYLVARVLAYAMEYTEGIEFSSGGLSSPDDPALVVRDLTGTVRSWIEIGTPNADACIVRRSRPGASPSTSTGTRHSSSGGLPVSAFTGPRRSSSGASTLVCSPRSPRGSNGA